VEEGDTAQVNKESADSVKTRDMGTLVTLVNFVLQKIIEKMIHLIGLEHIRELLEKISLEEGAARRSWRVTM
jgi:hypothetical protein